MLKTSLKLTNTKFSQFLSLNIIFYSCNRHKNKNGHDQSAGGNNSQVIQALLSLPTVYPVSKSRWRLLEYNTRRYYVDGGERGHRSPSRIVNNDDGNRQDMDAVQPEASAESNSNQIEEFEFQN